MGPLGRVAELADAQDSGSCVRKDVGVQVPPRPRRRRLSVTGNKTLSRYFLGVYACARGVTSGGEQGCADQSWLRSSSLRHSCWGWSGARPAPNQTRLRRRWWGPEPPPLGTSVRRISTAGPWLVPRTLLSTGPSTSARVVGAIGATCVSRLRTTSAPNYSPGVLMTAPATCRVWGCRWSLGRLRSRLPRSETARQQRAGTRANSSSTT